MGQPYGGSMKNKPFLRWAHSHHGRCCVCWEERQIETPFEDLHHIGRSGMGMKGSDLQVARVCRSCHAWVQGKRRLQFERIGKPGVWTALQADALELLAGWVREKAA